MLPGEGQEKRLFAEQTQLAQQSQSQLPQGRAGSHPAGGLGQMMGKGQ